MKVGYSVSDLITLAPDRIKLPLDIGTVLDTRYFVGLGVLGQRMLTLIDIAQLLSSTEMGLVDRLAA